KGLKAPLESTGTRGRIQRCVTMFTLFFNGGSPVRNLDEARAAAHEKFKRYFHGMLERGVYLPPSGYEAAFISLAHTSDEIEWTIESVRAVLSGLATPRT